MLLYIKAKSTNLKTHPHTHLAHYTMKRVLGPVLRSGSARILGMGCSFVFYFMVANLYGAGAMGRLAISLTLLSILSTCCTLGFSSSLVKFIAEDIENSPNHDPFKRLWRVLKLTCLTGLATALILFFLKDILALYIFNDPSLPFYFLMVSLVLVPLGVNTVLTAYHQAYDRPVLSSAMRFLFIPLWASLSITLFSPFLTDEETGILSHALGVGLSVLIGLFYTRHLNRSSGSIKQTSKTHHEIESDTLSYTGMLRLSMPLLFAGLSGMLLGWADTIMLGMMAGTHETGLYAVAFRLAIFIGLPCQMICWVVLSPFARAYHAGDKILQQRYITEGVHLGLAGGAVLMALFWLAGEFLLGLFGDEFKQAYPILIIIAAGMLIDVAFGLSATVMMMGDQQKRYQNILMMAVILNIALNMVAIPLYGALGAAGVTVLTQIFKQILMSGSVLRLTALNPVAGFAYVRLRSLEKNG